MKHIFFWIVVIRIILLSNCCLGETTFQGNTRVWMSKKRAYRLNIKLNLYLEHVKSNYIQAHIFLNRHNAKNLICHPHLGLTQLQGNIGFWKCKNRASRFNTKSCLVCISDIWNRVLFIFIYNHIWISLWIVIMLRILITNSYFGIWNIYNAMLSCEIVKKRAYRLNTKSFLVCTWNIWNCYIHDHIRIVTTMSSGCMTTMRM